MAILKTVKVEVDEKAAVDVNQIIFLCYSKQTNCCASAVNKQVSSILNIMIVTC